MTPSRPCRSARRLGAAFLVPLAMACGAGNAAPAGPPSPSTPAIARIDVSPGSSTVPVGGTVLLQAVARDASGGVISGTGFSWSSGAQAVASVSQGGLVTAVAPGSASITVSGGGRSATATVVVDPPRYDLDALGVPIIITADYIELPKVARISRFRSAIGHDYADDVESCRSMKHYFQPMASVDWSSLVIRSPVTGTIVSVQAEQSFGSQVRIVPAGQPAATVILFHVRLDAGRSSGDQVTAGDRLGTHIGSATMSDVAIWLDTPRGNRLVSYFDAMAEAVLARYVEWGLPSRAAAIISADERDADALTCNGESFAGPGTVANWIEQP